jgi:fucose permease
MASGTGRGLFVLALLAFASLGLPDGTLGVAWPSMRASFDLAPSRLGSLLATAMAGYLLSSFASGPVAARLGVGRLLLWSTLTVVASQAAVAAAPAWEAVVAAGLLVGLGAGGIDAGINAYAAARFPARLVTWLHGAYGLGAMLGPLALTAVLGAGLGWRAGYALVGAALAAMAVAFRLTLDRWSEAPPAAGGPAPGPAPALAATLRRPLVAGHAALFFLYTGLEVAAGQWAYSLLGEGRGVPPAVAGLCTSAYWASLAAGRIAAGFLARRWPPETVLRAAMAAAPAGAGLLWADLGTVASGLALAGLGLCFAPIFPLLIAATPARIGPAHAPNAIGLQVAAAYVGAAALPGLAGVLATAHGLEAIAPLLLAGALALPLAHEAVAMAAAPGRRLSGVPARSARPRP